MAGIESYYNEEDAPATPRGVSEDLMGLGGLGMPAGNGAAPDYNPVTGGYPGEAPNPVIAAATPRPALVPPTPPTYDAAGRRALMQRQAQLSQPIAENDPRYKPSVARVIAAIIASGAAGYGRNPNASQIGEDVLRDPYNRAERDRMRNLDAVSRQMHSQDDEFGLQEREYQGKERQYQAQLTAQDREERTKQAGLKTEPYTKPDANGEPLKTANGDYRMFRQMANGKEYEIAPVPASKYEGKPGMSDAEFRDKVYNKDPRAVDMFNKMHREPREPKAPRGTPAQFASANTNKNKQWQKANSDYQEEQAALKGIKDPATRAAKEKDALSNHITKLQSIQDEFEQNVETLGGTAQHQEVDQTGTAKPAGGGAKAANAPETPAARAGAPPAKAAAGKQKYNVGDAVQYKGKTMYIKSITGGKAELSDKPVR